MSTEQEDAVLLLELEEKITRRIREQIRMMADGVNTPAVHTYSDPALDPATTQYALYQNLRAMLLNDQTFITDMTKRIGQRMGQIY